jgi:serine-type D-Ala-D-Ala carboxypeptidase/endopeptidase (penicillin-binding protein 4)
LRLALAASLLALSLGAAAQLPAPVRAALARAGIPATAVGLVVRPIEGARGEVLHNADAPMNPASVMKVVTSYAALDLLGPAHSFKTDVLVTGTLAAGVLDGHLVLRGGGDPKLTEGELWRLVHQVRSRGIREIRGDVILDRSRFAPLAHDSGKFDNDARRAYNVGADALLVNFQAISFRFIADGTAARVIPSPDLPNVEIQSHVALTADPCTSWRRGIRHEVIDHGLLATVVFSGSMPSACGEREWALSVLDGARFTEASLRWLWSEAGGVLRGKVRAGTTPTDARVVFRHESPPLADLVRDMNKHSNNVMARHVFLALSAEKDGVGTEARSAALLHAWLADRRIPAEGFVVENG